MNNPNILCFKNENFDTNVVVYFVCFRILTIVIQNGICCCTDFYKPMDSTEKLI